MWKSFFFKFSHNIILVFLLLYTCYPQDFHFEAPEHQRTNSRPCFLGMKRYLCDVYNHPVDNMLLDSG